MLPKIYLHQIIDSAFGVNSFYTCFRSNAARKKIFMNAHHKPNETRSSIRCGWWEFPESVKKLHCEYPHPYSS